MIPDPILSASLAIQLHLLAAIPAVLVGPVALWRRRRDRWHRATGYVWVTSMALLAVTGLAIPSVGFALVGPFGLGPFGLGPFGPIHLLCFATFWGIAKGVAHARSGRTAAHRATMRGMYFGALALAGLFTLVPGRRLNDVLFTDQPALGWLAIVAGAGLVAMLWAGRAGLAKLALPFAYWSR